MKTKLKSMEVAAQRKAAEMLELETIAAQVNPLKERVARYRQDIRERDELIERLKADAHLREGKIVDLNSVINDWKCKVRADCTQQSTSAARATVSAVMLDAESISVAVLRLRVLE